MPNGQPDDYSVGDYNQRMFEGEQFNDMTDEATQASLQYYQEAFNLDIERLAQGDDSEWEKTKQYPASFMMMVEQLMCRVYGNK